MDTCAPIGHTSWIILGGVPLYVVIGFHKIKPEHVDDYLKRIPDHVQHSRAEAGCISYSLLRSTDDPTVMCLHEVFVDEAAYEVHVTSDSHDRWMSESKDWRDNAARVRHVLEPLDLDPKLRVP